jgi:hypothetical protein
MESARNISVIPTPSGHITTVAQTKAPVAPKIVVITCPICRVQGKKVFLPEAIQERSRNPSSIIRMLFSKELCAHAFIAYIDSDMNVKGYEGIDLII